MKPSKSSLRWLALIAPLVSMPLACSLLVESALSDKPFGEGGAGGAAGSTSTSGGADAAGGAAPCDGGCASSLTCCTDQCVDLKKDPANCGACGTTCSAGEVCCDGVGCAECCTKADCPTQDHLCTANQCILQCTSPAVACGDECAVLATSTKHCGSCVNDCLAGHTCLAGVCQSGWASMTTMDAPSARQRAIGVWTGSRLFIWGGQDAQGALSTGALYDPSSDKWSPVSTMNAPTARVDASGVLIGNKVLVWGGGPSTDQSAVASGKLYDPALNVWTDIPDAPIARRQAAAVSTGDRVVIWGGQSSGSPLSGGAIYDPQTNKWSTTALGGAPSARSGVAFAWCTATNELLLFGGRVGAMATNEAYAYSPSNNQWRTFSTSPLLPRNDAFAIVISDRLFVYGGRDGGAAFDDGAILDPAMNVWISTATVSPLGKRNAPLGRTGWVGIAAMRALFVGGMDSGQKIKTDGAQYDPATDMWPDVIPPFPSNVDHEYGVGVWTGAEMILWSGLDNNVLSPVGERFRP